MRDLRDAGVLLVRVQYEYSYEFNSGVLLYGTRHTVTYRNISQVIPGYIPGYTYKYRTILK